MTKTLLAIRVKETNLNHHLWDNNGTWWVHDTMHLPNYTKRRVRHSLGKDQTEGDIDEDGNH